MSLFYYYFYVPGIEEAKQQPYEKRNGNSSFKIHFGICVSTNWLMNGISLFYYA